MHEEFLAIAQGIADGIVPVFAIESENFDTLMTIGTEDGYIYITKEQARVFFGLTETP
jgi:hypothetical protein